MPDEGAYGRFFCESCSRRYDDFGDCPHCVDAALVDLGDAQVRQRLSDADDARWRKRALKWTVLAFAVTSPLCVGLAWVLSVVLGIVVWGIVGSALAGFLANTFPPPMRIPMISIAQIRAFDESADDRTRRTA